MQSLAVSRKMPNFAPNKLVSVTREANEVV